MEELEPVEADFLLPIQGRDSQPTNFKHYIQIDRQIDIHIWASQVVLVVKNPPANAGDFRDAGLIPGWERSPGGGHGNPLQYSCLENPVDRRAWQTTVLGVAEE